MKAARASLRLTQDELAKSVGGSKRGIQQNESGETEPGSTVLRGFLGLGINANWILTGEGPMRIDDLKPAGTLDPARLKLAVETVEEGLHQTRRTMAPEKKAELVLAVYDLYADGVAAQAKERILRLVKSAA